MSTCGWVGIIVCVRVCGVCVCLCLCRCMSACVCVCHHCCGRLFKTMNCSLISQHTLISKAFTFLSQIQLQSITHMLGGQINCLSYVLIPPPPPHSVLLSIPGMEVDPQDDDGWTPLHAAIYWGCMEAAELLILSGANIFLKTNNVRGAGREGGRCWYVTVSHTCCLVLPLTHVTLGL